MNIVRTLVQEAPDLPQLLNLRCNSMTRDTSLKAHVE